MEVAILIIFSIVVPTFDNYSDFRVSFLFFKGWYSPSPRGAGYLFGELITEEFNHINGLDLIARAHQLCHQGYNFMHNHKLVTVWSAPNYSYRCGNSASICMVTDKLTRHFQVFTKSED